MGPITYPVIMTHINISEKEGEVIAVQTPLQGVYYKILKVNADSRGYFMEVLRDDWDVLDKMEQVSVSITMPGVIKAFHVHEEQDEILHILDGMARLVLYDLRQNSSTKGKLFEKVIGRDVGKEFIFIPRGVAHAYQVLGTEPLRSLYVANKVYNKDKPDQKSIPYDDPTIGFDWTIKS